MIPRSARYYDDSAVIDIDYKKLNKNLTYFTAANVHMNDLLLIDTYI